MAQDLNAEMDTCGVGNTLTPHHLMAAAYWNGAPNAVADVTMKAHGFMVTWILTMSAKEGAIITTIVSCSSLSGHLGRKNLVPHMM